MVYHRFAIFEKIQIPMLSVREIQKEDIDLLADYWFRAKPEFLRSMGVDLTKMPDREGFIQMLLEQLDTPLAQRRSYALAWLADGQPIGHTNTNPTFFGDYAHLHLHIWDEKYRKKGLGVQLVKMALPFFFEKLQLERLISEPYALNNGPNRTLERVGFELEKEYTTTPGFINFEQPVKRWVMTKENYERVFNP